MTVILTGARQPWMADYISERESLAKKLFKTDPRIISIADRFTEQGGMTRAQVITRAWEREQLIVKECIARANAIFDL